MKTECFCNGALIRDTRDVPYTYKGEATIIWAVTADFCQDCGEIVVLHDDRYSNWVLSFDLLVESLSRVSKDSLCLNCCSRPMALCDHSNPYDAACGEPYLVPLYSGCCSSACEKSKRYRDLGGNPAFSPIPNPQ
jgi:YgiT-type zinc finger domain-containing protein